MCFPYRWKRPFLRRENKDIDSPASHSKVVNSVAFILCVWNTYNEKINKRPQHSHKVFHLLQGNTTGQKRKNRAMRLAVSVFPLENKTKKMHFRTLRPVLIFNRKILEQMPRWMYIGSSNVESK